MRRTTEHHKMGTVESIQEEVYANADYSANQMEKRQSAKETAAAKNTQNHIILILVILLVFKVVMVILISIQLTYINNLREEMSHVKPGDGNVALNGVASQSSTLDGQSSAKNAIDGNLDPNFLSGSCAHTKEDAPPWWRVNLQQPHKISKVIITNRGDCCWDRLTGASILIGNSLENNGKNNPSCAEISTIQNNGALILPCNDMVGQYVNIIIKEKQQYLTLCEVQVFGVPYGGNVALRGVATQSSILDGFAANNAIDGNLDYNLFSGSCAHTGDDVSPWWRVDLLQPHTISKVIITNRGDCCWERLAGASILVGNSTENNGNNNPSCAVISFIQNRDALTFLCNDMIGQYVNIVIKGKTEYLQLCEVQVFGVPATG
ncbi:uncharacterized protein [Hyperolius riggenbachi]|uniref:uncharacterized protein isoform X2 n=1 Tax=Hyperolius riggenbachi TaxID=752182 RepID=UPI0035A3A776